MTMIRLTLEADSVDDVEIETRSGRLYSVSVEASWDVENFASAIDSENGNEVFAALVTALLDRMNDDDRAEIGIVDWNDE